MSLNIFCKESRYSLGSSALLLLAETSVSVLLEERLLSGRIWEVQRKLWLLGVFFRILPTPGVPGVSLTLALLGVPLTPALPGVCNNPTRVWLFMQQVTNYLRRFY